MAIKGISLRRLLPPLNVLALAVSLPGQEKLTWSPIYFSPDAAFPQVIIKKLANAKTSILVQAYSFTSAPIAKALLNPHKKGVKIDIIFKTPKTQKYSSADFLVNSGISTKIDAARAIAHNKVRILDREVVIK
jgi:phosphatidylserine/phosphatidylglycerophosphate/cardiolipin synthase-like enzyme